MSGKIGWIAVDLDGTLARYDGWVSEEHIGAPVPAMLDRVKTWLAAGADVRIFTARVDGGEVALSMGDPLGEAFRDVARIRGFIEAWCLEHVGQVLPVTNRKDYGMIELWDDRCVGVVPNTGEPAQPLTSRQRWAIQIILDEQDGGSEEAPGAYFNLSLGDRIDARAVLRAMLDK